MPSLSIQTWRRRAAAAAAVVMSLGCNGQHSSTPTIALIPQAAEGLLWELARAGATEEAERNNFQTIWYTPTSESDATGQVSLINEIGQGESKGLIVAPNHPLAPLTALRRAVETGIPVVVVSTPLNLPPNSNLGYIVNGDAEMGALAAAEVARLINGEGLIALIGLSQTAAGVTSRARGVEAYLARNFPQIKVVSRRGGAFSASAAQETTVSVLAEYPDLDAIVGLTANSTRGAHAALRNRSLQPKVHLVGCEQDTDLLNYVGTGEIAGIVAENTYRMAQEAVGLISAYRDGKPMPAMSIVPPMLITSDNVGSEATRDYAGPSNRR